jgi:hypothetical protein
MADGRGGQEKEGDERDYSRASSLRFRIEFFPMIEVLCMLSRVLYWLSAEILQGLPASRLLNPKSSSLLLVPSKTMKEGVLTKA